MRFDSDAVPEALDRLRRIEGQVRGVIGMIEQGRDCEEVVEQIAAAANATSRVGMRLLAAQYRACVAQGSAAPNGAKATPGAKGTGRANGDRDADAARFERLFLMLS